MISKQKKIGAIIAFVCILAIIVIVIAINNGDKRTAMIVFQKDNQMHFMYASKKEPVQLTEQMYEQGNKLISPTFIVTDNAKKIFYSDNIKDRVYDLYYKDIKKNKSVKVASGVKSYEVSIDGKKVYYISEDALYCYDMKESKRIADKVSRFYISDNGKKVLYITTDSASLYYKNGNKEAKKLATEASVVSHTDNFKQIAYISNGSLYITDAKDKTETIADDVTQYIMYDNKDIIYITSDDYSVTYASIITDSLKGETAPSISSDEYVDYTIRNMVRQQVLEDESLRYEYSVRTLYYYDGKKSEMIKANMGTICDSIIDEKQLVYTTYESMSMPKMDIKVFNEYSGIQYKEDIDNYITNLLLGKPTYNLLIGDTNHSLPIDGTTIKKCVLKNDGSALYYIKDTALCEQKISGRRLKKATEYATNVSVLATYPYAESIVYVKDYDAAKNRGSLYMDDKLVDNEVFIPGESLNYVEINDDCVAYLHNYSYDTDNGTLKYYDGKKATVISENIEYGKYYMLADNQLAYLKDKVLYIADAKNNRKVAENVQTVYRYIYSDDNKKAYYK
ncbi:MAG: hypothetical protein IKL73_05075 [Lachnospiraceae bacterium]|nr:hypothetical protein [Lachnospiraceae bacterium]